MVLREQQLRQIRRRAATEIRELALERSLQVQLFFEPYRQRGCKRPETLRGIRQIGLEQALELHERLVVEHDVAQIANSAARFRQALFDCGARETRVVLAAREALFLGRGDDLPIAQERCGAVVILGGDSKDVRAAANVGGSCIGASQRAIAAGTTVTSDSRLEMVGVGCNASNNRCSSK